MTPRPGKDTTAAAAGRRPGLSVWESGPKPGQKGQRIDPDLLREAGLAYLSDDPLSGQTGHGVIAPVDAAGNVDQGLLEEWASHRGTGRRHRLTQAVLDAIVEHDVRSEP